MLALVSLAALTIYNLRIAGIFAGLLVLSVVYYLVRVRGKVDTAWARRSPDDRRGPGSISSSACSIASLSGGCRRTAGASLFAPVQWVDEHVTAARALLAPHGIAVTAITEPFTPSRCQLLTRADRDALAADVNMDGDGDGAGGAPRARSGRAELRPEGRALEGRAAAAGSSSPPMPGRRCWPTSWAHYFGLPHDPAGGNLMTPGPSSPAWKSPHPPAPFAPVLTPMQVERLRAGIRAGR